MENSEKRVHLNIMVPPAVKSAVQRIAKRERRTDSNVTEILLEWALVHLAERGASTLELIEGSAPRTYRISQETQEICFTALRAIFEHAPSTVVEEIVERLTETAGKFGAERESQPPRRPFKK